MYNSSIKYMYMYIQFLEGIKSLVIKKRDSMLYL